MAQRIAIANHKGGVGKSTTALMLAEGLALWHGMRVLTIDLDPQTSLSTMLLSRQGADAAAASGRSLSNVLAHLAAGRPVQLAHLLVTKASDLVELRDATGQGRVDLLPSHRHLLTHLSAHEAALRSRFGQRLDVALAQALEPEFARLDKSYDVVIFDTAAGTGPLTLAAVRLAPLVISPTVLDAVSLGALQDFIKIVIDHDLALSKSIRHFVLPTMFDVRDPHQVAKLDQIRVGLIRLQCIPREIRRTVGMERAGERLKPDAFKTAREKYGPALGDVQGLAADVARILHSKESRP